jgi:DNA polymerase elongation subunit (family B)
VKVLALDIETRPNIAYVWGLWDDGGIPLDRLIQPVEMMCFAAKWLGEKRTHFHSAQNERKAMIQSAHDLLSEADVVIHYNGKRFDIPHLNREFVQVGLGPPAPYQQIDLFQVVKRQFKFPSNKLAHVAPALGLKGKVEHSGFKTWVRCMAGDEKAWREMERYNRRDVTLLEELYTVLQPWIPNHPTRTLHDGTTGCPVCSSQNLMRRGMARTKVSAFQRWSCNDCGAWSRSSKREASVELQQIAV